MNSKRLIYAIENCEFDYECPLNWEDLDKLDDPDLRYCQTCLKNVRRVATSSELDQAASQGECVALAIYDAKFIQRINDWESGKGPDPWLGEQIKMPVGLIRKK